MSRDWDHTRRLRLMVERYREQATAQDTEARQHIEESIQASHRAHASLHAAEAVSFILDENEQLRALAAQLRTEASAARAEALATRDQHRQALAELAALSESAESREQAAFFAGAAGMRLAAWKRQARDTEARRAKTAQRAAGPGAQP